MHRIFAALVAALIAFAWHGPARASGDYGCAPSWRLVHTDLTGCDNMAFLQPGNDTRVNLALLMFDLHPGKAAVNPAARADPLFAWYEFVHTLYTFGKPSDDENYVEGEGSRCRSNSSGTASFEAAVNAARMSPPERTALIAARRGLKPNCIGASSGANAVAALDGQIKSPQAMAFAAYLKGALAFYDADYDKAAAQFTGLRASDPSWLKETAHYMLGRVEVNRLQLSAFDDYGTLKEDRPIDDKAIAAAEAGLRDYLRGYPKGAYAASARGLLRRVYWLGNKQEKLAAEYAALLKASPAQRSISDIDLLDEIDNKLLAGLDPAAKVDPLLLAVLDLQAMRQGEEANDAKPLPLAQIAAQHAAFARNQPLYDFLRAAHAFYVARDPADVLRLIPDVARQQGMSYLQFSRQMLRGMALEAQGDRNARGFWTDLLGSARQSYQRQAVELALAMHDERSNGLARLFEPGSPIHADDPRDPARICRWPAAPAPAGTGQGHDEA